MFSQENLPATSGKATWMLYVGFVVLNTVNNTTQLDCHRQCTVGFALKELTGRKFKTLHS